MAEPATTTGHSMRKDNRVFWPHGSAAMPVPASLTPAIKYSHSDTSVSVKPPKNMVASGMRVLNAGMTADVNQIDMKIDEVVTSKETIVQNKKKLTLQRKAQKTKTDYASTVKNIFDVHLAHLTELKLKAQNDIPDPPKWLIMVLRMPQVIKVFHFIRYRRHKFEKQRCFVKWYNETVEQYNNLLDCRQEAAKVVQKRFRGYHTRHNLWVQRCAMLAQFNKAARILQVCLRAMAIRKRIEERKKNKIFPITVLIQSVIRMFLHRRRYLYQLRKKLYRSLRVWSEGRIHNLLRRPGSYCFVWFICIFIFIV